MVEPREMLACKPPSDSLIWDMRLCYRLAEILEPFYLRRMCGVSRPYGMLPRDAVDQLALFSASATAAGELDGVWKRFEWIVERIQADAKARGARFSLLVLPIANYEQMVARARTAKIPFEPPGDGSLEVLIGRLREIAERQGAGFIYPAEAFAKAAEDGVDLISPGGHYAAAGNRLIAELMLRDSQDGAD